MRLSPTLVIGLNLDNGHHNTTTIRPTPGEAAKPQDYHNVIFNARPISRPCPRHEGRTMNYDNGYPSRQAHITNFAIVCPHSRRKSVTSLLSASVIGVLALVMGSISDS
jgi:hypothetical protein